MKNDKNYEDVSPEQAAAKAKKNASKKSNKNAVRSTVDGIKYKLHPVAANVLRDAQMQIKDARIRTFKNPTTGKEEENPAHPEYIMDEKEVQEKRIKASMNALVLFGLELIDPIPSDNNWLKKILFINLITQKEYDEATSPEGKFLRELFYKNYVFTDLKILNELSTLSGVTQESIAKAKKSFQRSKKRSAD